jgi:hypothetical protein
MTVDLFLQEPYLTCTNLTDNTNPSKDHNLYLARQHKFDLRRSLGQQKYNKTLPHEGRCTTRGNEFFVMLPKHSAHACVFFAVSLETLHLPDERLEEEAEPEDVCLWTEQRPIAPGKNKKSFILHIWQSFPGCFLKLTQSQTAWPGKPASSAGCRRRRTQTSPV